MVIALWSLLCLPARGHCRGWFKHQAWMENSWRKTAHSLTHQYLQDNRSIALMLPYGNRCRQTHKTCVFTDTNAHPARDEWQNCLQAVAAIWRPSDKRSTTNSWPVRRTIWLPFGARETPMQAVLSWKSSFLSNRASSVTNRRPLLTKWEPARQMSPASLTLFFSLVYVQVFDGTSRLDLGREQGCLPISLGNIRNMCWGDTWKRLHSVLTPPERFRACLHEGLKTMV